MKTAMAGSATHALETIHGLFDVQASSTPDAVAVIHANETTTYRELASRAAQWADELTLRGLQPGDVVGLCTRRTPGLIALMLGIMKVGGVSVPVDFDVPAERRRQIFTDCAPKIVVTADEQNVSGYTVTSPAPLTRAAGDQPHLAGAHRQPVGPGPIWAMLYTSGVTGKPNGVRVIHTQVTTYLSWMWQTFPFRPGDVSLLHTSPMLISSAWDYFGPLLRGVPMLVLSEREAVNPAVVVKACVEHGVSHVSAPPGLWQALLDRPSSELSEWTSLRIGISRGDHLSVETVRTWRAKLPGARLLNGYGMTECWRPATFDTSELAQDADRVPAGRPLPGASVYICDDNLRERATGEMGEVYVSGVCLSDGYHASPGLTAQRFVPNPFSNGEHSRLFRTGDIGFRKQDGNLVLVGRADQQVSIRGYRVETGDIECALRRCAGVREAVVVPRAHTSGTTELVAHVVLQPDAHLDVATLRSELALFVSPYMIPAVWAITDALPRTASGKIDRQALLLASSQPRGVGETVREQWRTPTEERLASLWVEVIACPAIGLDDGFLDLGGDSIMAMRLVSRISERFSTDVTVDDLFANATVVQVAAQIDANMATQR